MVGRQKPHAGIPRGRAVASAIKGVGLPIGLRAQGPTGWGGAIPSGKGKGSMLSRTLRVVGPPSQPLESGLGQGKGKGEKWVPGVGFVDVGQLKGISAGKVGAGSGKGTDTESGGPLFWNHMQSLLGVQLRKSQTPEYPWATEEARMRREGPLFRPTPKPPTLLRPGTGWSARKSEPAPAPQVVKLKQFLGVGVTNKTVVEVPSSCRMMAWKPVKKRLPWPRDDITGTRRTKEDEEWECAIAKWRALVEEAGTCHSGLARKIARIKEDPSNKLALERSVEERTRDLLDNQFAKKAPRTLLKKGWPCGHVHQMVQRERGSPFRVVRGKVRGLR